MYKCSQTHTYAPHTVVHSCIFLTYNKKERKRTASEDFWSKGFAGRFCLAAYLHITELKVMYTKSVQNRVRQIVPKSSYTWDCELCAVAHIIVGRWVQAGKREYYIPLIGIEGAAGREIILSKLSFSSMKYV